MRSCAERTLVTAAALVLVCGAVARAQGDPAAAYEALRAREGAQRLELVARVPGSKPAALLKRVRATIADYDAMSRKHRTSGYSDNALWQAALLSADLYASFGEETDRRAARRLLTDLAARFPASSLVRGIPAQQALLESRPPRRPAAAVTSPPPAETVPRTARVSLPASAASSSTLTDLRREVVGETQRITLSFDREVPFSSERATAARLAIDVPGARVVYALKDARLTWPDGLVRGIRVVRTDAAGVRVLVDLDGAARHSIYPMYGPYRLVIDVSRSARTAVASAKAPAAAADSPTVRPSGAPAAAPPSVQDAATAPDPPSERPAANATARGRGAPTAEARAQASRGRGGVSLSRQLGLGAARIVIDAGHGGHDPGALGSGISEAELVLAVALKLEALLRAEPGVDVIMTRRANEFVPLEERTALANKAGADLFLSIHANASTNRDARGIETYFLNFAPNAAAEAIAARENAASTKTMRSLTDIVQAIATNDKLDESRAFATRVQAALFAGLRRTNTQVRNLGVKQAPFQVLVGATMPSILAEISFLTNEREGTLLKTDRYRAQIAQALFDGIMAYQESLKPDTVVAAK